MKRIRPTRAGVLALALACGLGVAQIGIGGSASAAAGGGMTSHKGTTEGDECFYRPGQLIAPPGMTRPLSKYAGQAVREIGSLVPERIKNVLPNTVMRYSIYDIGTADPFDTAVAANSAGISAAPNYISSFAPGVRTWAPGEDAVSLATAQPGIAGASYGEGLRIGVLDTGMNGKLPNILKGTGQVTFRSAASIAPALQGLGLMASGYNQPTELTVGRAAGHGTFISGLLRRAVPGARLMVAQVPFFDASDALFDVAAAPGFADDKSSRADDAALTYTLYAAFAGGGVTNVDVLSLSFGTYGCGSGVAPEAGNGDFRVPVGVRSALLGLWELSGRTLRVAAAAGNDRTDEPFYPAAYAASTCFEPGNVPPNSGPAVCKQAIDAKSTWLGGVSSTPSAAGAYSNEGPWALVRANGSDVASLRHDLQWWSWSGTSFAAPCAALQSALRPWMEWPDVAGVTLDCGLAAKP